MKKSGLISLLLAAVLLLVATPLLAHCGHCGMADGAAAQQGEHQHMARHCDKCGHHDGQGKHGLKCADCEREGHGGHHGMHDQSGGQGHDHDAPQQDENLDALFEKS